MFQILVLISDHRNYKVLLCKYMLVAMFKASDYFLIGEDPTMMRLQHTTYPPLSNMYPPSGSGNTTAWQFLQLKCKKMNFGGSLGGESRGLELWTKESWELIILLQFVVKPLERSPDVHLSDWSFSHILIMNCGDRNYMNFLNVMSRKNLSLACWAEHQTPSRT